MEITSPQFKNNESIPSKFTCDGENINPELNIKDIPKGTKSLALIMDDPDIPDSVKENLGIEEFEHWNLFNIGADVTAIKENTAPGIEGKHSGGGVGYTGPCPPDGEHRYFFKLFALDADIDLSGDADKAALEEAMSGHVLDKAELMGLYSR